MKYTALIAYDVTYYADIEIEAANDAEAIKIAKQRAKESEGCYNAYDNQDNRRVCDVMDADGEIVAEAIDV